MAKQNVYIHIGAHKSASTTIQVNCNLNVNLLKDEHKVTYFQIPAYSQSPFQQHFRNLTHKKILNDDEYTESLKQAKISLSALMVNIETPKIFFSHEGFLGHSNLNEYKGFYNEVPRVIHSLHHIFSEYKLHIILIVRRQDTFIESCYLQQIKEQNYIKFIEFTSQLDIDNLSWLNIAKEINKQIPLEQMNIYPFEEIIRMGSQSFLKLFFKNFLDVNINDDDFKYVLQANPSLSGIGLDLALNTLPHLPNASSAKSHYKLLLSEFSNIKHPKPILFAPFVKQALLKYFEDDNNELFSKYIPTLTADYYQT